MANNFNEYLRNTLLNEAFGGTAWTPPATLYIGLSTTAIADNGTGATEPTGGYARQAVTNNKTNFTTATGATNEVSNSTEISFPEATGAWGTITHFFVSDALTGGNVLTSGALTTAKTVASGDIANFPIGSIVINLDDV